MPADESRRALECVRCGRKTIRVAMIDLRPCDCGSCVFRSTTAPDGLAYTRQDLKFLEQARISPE